MTVATVIVDMQRDFLGHPGLAARRSRLVANTNELTDMARAAGSLVIFVRQVYATDLRDAPLEIRTRNIPIVLAGTAGAELDPRLKQLPSDLDIIKKRYSAFYGTTLDELLKRAACDTLIVAGVNTHACIRTTVVVAYQRDFNVWLAGDCIDSYDQEHHRISVRYLDGKLGMWLSNAQIRARFAHLLLSMTTRSPSTP